MKVTINPSLKQVKFSVLFIGDTFISSKKILMKVGGNLAIEFESQNQVTYCGAEEVTQVEIEEIIVRESV